MRNDFPRYVPLVAMVALVGCTQPYKAVMTLSGTATVTPDKPRFTQVVLVEMTPHRQMEQYVLGAVRWTRSIRFDIQPDEQTKQNYVLHRKRPFTNGYAVDCKEGTTCTLRFILTGEYEGRPLSAPLTVAWEASTWIEEDVRWPRFKPRSVVKIRKAD